MSSVGPEGEAQWRALERKREIREIVLELLDSPLDLPDRFRGWIPRLVESSGIQVPISQVVGNFVVADTTAGLGGTIHGRGGMVRVGASPYDYFQLVYDGTTSQWVSNPLVLVTQTVQAVSHTGNTSWASNTEAAKPIIIYGAFIDAGLKLQVRHLTAINNSAATTDAALFMEPFDSGWLNTTNQSHTLSTSSSTPVFKDSGWSDIPAMTKKTYLVIEPKYKTSSAAATAYVHDVTVFGRWVSE